MELKDLISSGILEEYVLGTTSQQDNAEIEGYIKNYPEIKIEIDQISIALEKYATAYSVVPGTEIKSRIFERINTAPTLRSVASNNKYTPIYKINGFLKFAAAACFFLLLTSIFFNYTLYNKYNKSKQDVVSIKEELEAQKQVAIDMNKDMSVVKNKMAIPVVLNGTPNSPESLAKIFWMKNTGDVYIDPSNLPTLPTDKQYQLWAIVDSKPVDGGVISTKNGDIYHMQKMKAFGKAQAFAITIEKAGGSPTPTMKEMVVISKI